MSVTVFTAPWHNPSKGLYKCSRKSLKSYQRCNSAFIYMFSMKSANGCAFICVFNSMRGKWNCLNTKLCVFYVSPLPPLLRSAPRPLFLAFFKTVVRTNQCWNRGFHDPLKHSHRHSFTLFAVVSASMASCPSWSLRSCLMVTTIWRDASMWRRRSWRLCTRLCQTIMCIWREPCWNPTWWPLATPAPTSTLLRRSPCPPSPPCAAPFLRPSPVSRCIPHGIHLPPEGTAQ